MRKKEKAIEEKEIEEKAAELKRLLKRCIHTSRTVSSRYD